jgi:5-methyltetrahydrofolate--homocysteine methyltransferase
MFSYEQLEKGIISGDVNAVQFEVNKALSKGVNPRDVLVKGLIGSMTVVGKRFSTGETFLPEVLASANAMHKGLDIVKRLLPKSSQKAATRIVMGTVEGDIHDIGKKIVSFLLEGNGYEVIDIGINVKAEVFAQAVEEYKPDILGMSALLTTTIPNMKKTIDLLKEKGIREKVKIIVGGAPVTDEFADSIGADGYAPEAGSAVRLVKKLVGEE